MVGGIAQQKNQLFSCVKLILCLSRTLKGEKLLTFYQRHFISSKNKYFTHCIHTYMTCCQFEYVCKKVYPNINVVLCLCVDWTFFVFVHFHLRFKFKHFRFAWWCWQMFFFFNFFCPYTVYNKYSLILSCLNPVGFHLCQSTVKSLVASAERV